MGDSVCGGTSTLWNCSDAGLSLIQTTELSLHTLDVLHAYVSVHVCVRVCTRTLTHAFTRTVKPDPGVFSLHNLADSRHGLSQTSEEDAAAPTSSPIKSRSFIMSALAPDPWQALSTCRATWNQYPNYSPSMQRKCPHSFKANSFVVVKTRLRLRLFKLFIYYCLWTQLGFNPSC